MIKEAVTAIRLRVDLQVTLMGWGSGLDEDGCGRRYLVPGAPEPRREPRSAGVSPTENQMGMGENLVMWV